MAERDLEALLSTLSVDRQDGVWRFETFKMNMIDQLKSIGPSSQSVMVFKEREGMTVIAPVKEVTPRENRWVWLELSVFSDLHAVGFMAAIAKALTEADVPCNVVAGFHHDHIFVPEAKAEAAIAALEALSERS